MKRNKEITDRDKRHMTEVDITKVLTMD